MYWAFQENTAAIWNKLKRALWQRPTLALAILRFSSVLTKQKVEIDFVGALEPLTWAIIAKNFSILWLI